MTFERMDYKMGTQYIDVEKCADCPFYSEYSNSELYACICLVTQEINEDDTVIGKNCPLLRFDILVSKKE